MLTVYAHCMLLIVIIIIIFICSLKKYESSTVSDTDTEMKAPCLEGIYISSRKGKIFGEFQQIGSKK